MDYGPIWEQIFSGFGVTIEQATKAIAQLATALNELRPELDALIENPNQNEVLEKITPIGYSKIEPIFSTTDNCVKEKKQDD